MTQYAASSVTAFVPAGGVCAGHSLADKPADPDYKYLSVDCPVCEPILADDPLWASTPGERPLTAAEEREREHLKAQAEERRQQMDDARDRAIIALAAKLEKLPLDDESEDKPAKTRTRKTSGASA
jgi:hypothetical protein